MQAQFVPFDFFGDLFFGRIWHLDRWRELLAVYHSATPGSFMSAVRSDDIGEDVPSFTLNSDKSQVTLEEWAKSNGMFDELMSIGE
ncbi:MAG: hypothetical protein IPK84_04115 [Candidatus Moraniibacteriota bacterium]|nr:MAG: hypothetical protein IPK84_04115 [Candidatus Moranbacteria bacterium]